MNRYQLATALFINASLLSPATFAHVPPKGETLPIAAKDAFNWTGFYAGINAGVVKHSMNITDNNASTFFATIQQTSNPDFTGGLQVGYRRQLTMSQASGVYGLEFSANFSDATMTKEYGSPFALYQLSSQNKLKNVCLLQLIGGIAADRTFLFLAAGFSRSDITGHVTNTDGIPFFNAFNVGKNAMGTALGGGIEYAINEKITARFKVDVITPTVYSSNAYSEFGDSGDTFQMANNIVQATIGVNYKFG